VKAAWRVRRPRRWRGKRGGLIRLVHASQAATRCREDRAWHATAKKTRRRACRHQVGAIRRASSAPLWTATAFVRMSPRITRPVSGATKRPFERTSVRPDEQHGPAQHQRRSVPHGKAVAPRNIPKAPEKLCDPWEEHRQQRARVRDRTGEEGASEQTFFAWLHAGLRCWQRGLPRFRRRVASAAGDLRHHRSHGRRLDLT
jgi:hypothetical protein